MAWWIIAAFIAGEAAGLITAAIVSGRLDDYMEWRKRKNGKKTILDRFDCADDDHRGADLAERDKGK